MGWIVPVLDVLNGFEHHAPGHDDDLVAVAEVLLGAVLDDAFALSSPGVLRGHAGNAAVAGRRQQRAILQVAVVLVLDEPVAGADGTLAAEHCRPVDGTAAPEDEG